MSENKVLTTRNFARATMPVSLACPCSIASDHYKPTALQPITSRSSYSSFGAGGKYLYGLRICLGSNSFLMACINSTDSSLFE